MNVKEKSKKKKKDKHQITPAQNEHQVCTEGCTCSYFKREEELSELTKGKSHVRISGRIGLTEDDKYVLRCAATVDGQEIPNEYTKIGSITSPLRLGSFFKTGDNNNKAREYYGKHSQGTDANFNDNILEEYNKCRSVLTKRDQTVQCNCHDNILNKTIVTDAATAINALKQCHSPVVIISVYPGHTKEIPEIGLPKRKSSSPSPSRRLSNKSVSKSSNSRSEIRKKTNRNEQAIRSQRSRPPSRTPSPIRSPSPRLTKTFSTKKEINQKNSREKTQKREKLEATSTQNKERNYSVHKSTPYKGIKTATEQNKIKNKNTVKSHSLSNSELAKKAIIEDFTKNVVDRMGPDEYRTQYKDEIIPVKNVSNVTIDIDGDQEHYNVEFQHNDFITDLIVRKTTKKNKSKKRQVMEQDSFEKHFEFETRKKSESLSQDQPPNRKLLKTTSILNVKDSLELSHRAKSNQCNVKVQTKLDSQDEQKEMELISPVKHSRDESFMSQNVKIMKPNVDDLKKGKTNEIKFDECASLRNTGDVQAKIEKGCDPHKCRTQVFYEEVFNSSVKENINKIETSVESTFLMSSSNPQETDKEATDDTQICSETTKEMMFELDKTLILERNVQHFIKVNKFTKQKPLFLTQKQYQKIKRKILISLLNKSSNSKNRLNGIHSISIGEVRKKPKKSETKVNCLKKGREEIETDKIENDMTRTVQIHYTNVEFEHLSTSKRMKPSTKYDQSDSMKSASIHTIFKGFRRSRTPNLGNSDLSLYPENGTDKSILSFKNKKTKKPFLRRLMSCLVMRITKSDEKNFQSSATKSCKAPSIVTINSFDLYNINTSVGAFEISSSVYDTSVSFYSNHTVIPASSKFKKGFWSSMRSLLPSFKT